MNPFIIARLALVCCLCWGTVQGVLAQAPEEIERNTAEADELLEQARRAVSTSQKESLAQKSLSMARDLRYDGGIARASVMLGEVYAHTGKPQEALQYYLEAEAKLESSGNKPLQLIVKTAIGDLFFEEKLYASARRYYREVLAMKPEDFDTREKAADACLYDMRFDSAEILYKDLIYKFKEEGNNPRLVQIYQKRARAYDAAGDAGKSLYYYLLLQDIIETAGTTQEQSLLYNNLGRQYVSLRDYPKALEYFRKAEMQCSYIPCDYPEVLWANMGIALHNTGESKRGIEYLLKAQKLLMSRKDYTALANLEHLMATVYFGSNDIYNALSHNQTAIQYAKDTKQKQVLAEAYRTGADLYHDLYDFEKAFEYYREYLNVLDEIRQEDQTREQRLTQQRALLSAAEGQIKFLIARQNFKDLELNQVKFERERLELLNKNLELEARRKEDEVRLLEAQKDADQAKLREQTLQALQARAQLRLAAQQLDAEKQNRLIVELREKERLERVQNQADSTRRAQELEQIQREQAYRNEKEANFRRFAYILGLALFLILLVVGISWWFARRAKRRVESQNRQIQAQKIQIEAEKQKSDVLLRNILPEEIAAELKTSGQATPRLYESATVLFSDFVNFTSLSAKLTPEQLIDELNECFLAFDEICERHGLEKIKTIGDAYMCAGGLPVPNETHATDAVGAALEMAAWLKHRRETNPDSFLTEMRIGIHTGPVMAGVIGKNKFAYDIWGDAVNLAARLEEHGEPGRVNISGATAAAVKHLYQAEHRGQKDVHNKGQVDMYFIVDGGR
ncbi:MAG TPA: adenylate/guanylate cyclase domain-containing protein [Saprospiraceae bacterium]|nr:adenylate/guanylate cyclase domain-containing protein [Saprospiraceae bacterium]